MSGRCRLASVVSQRRLSFRWRLLDRIPVIREHRRRTLERELERTQAELRATILRLASELGADAHEARKALIRESYLASGRMPDERA